MAEQASNSLCLEHAATNNAMAGEWSVNLSPEEIVKYYDEWMESKEFDYEKVDNYHGVRALAEHMKPHLDKLVNLNRILDIGAGTGFLASELKRLVGDNVVFDALEPSEKSREVAKKKGLYSEYFSDFVTGLNSTSLASETYDCVCAIACFGPSHIPAYGAEEMMRLTKIGGIIAFFIRSVYVSDHPVYKGNIMEILQKMIENGIAEKLEIIHNVPYIGDDTGVVVIFRKIGHI